MKAEPKVTNRTETDGDLHVQQQAPERQQTHSKTEVNSWKRRQQLKMDEAAERTDREDETDATQAISNNGINR